MNDASWNYAAKLSNDGEVFGFVTASTSPEATLKAYRQVRSNHPEASVRTMHVERSEDGDTGGR